MKVIKIGGGCFKDEKVALAIIKLIFENCSFSSFKQANKSKLYNAS